MTITTQQPVLRQLDERTADNGQLRVELLWDSELNRVYVIVDDHRTMTEVEVDPADALDAFMHPYAYLN